MPFVKTHLALELEKVKVEMGEQGGWKSCGPSSFLTSTKRASR